MILFKSDVISNQAQAGILTEYYLTVEAAARQTGYKIQYLQRVLRTGRLEGVKNGQAWLIKLSSLENYFLKNEGREDHRCGPQANYIRSKTPNVYKCKHIGGRNDCNDLGCW